MLIGEWNIKEAGAYQHRVTFGNNTISNSSEWVKGNLNPSMLGNSLGFKTIKTVLVVKGADREEILERKSIIISKCLDPVILTLDSYHHKFYAVLKKTDTEEMSMSRWHLLTLEWNCYEFGEEISQSFNGYKVITVHNPGNIVTPAIISVTPSVGVAALTLTGLSRNLILNEEYDIVVRNAETNIEILLDGESGIITQGGQINAGDVEIWELPSLMPGENRITLDAIANVTVTFRPRYM